MTGISRPAIQPAERAVLTHGAPRPGRAAELFLICAFFLWWIALPAVSQEWCRYVSPGSPSHEWNTHWVSCPLSDSLSHVWFRQTYVTGRDGDLPVSAHLSVASSGYLRVYVNECNVGMALWYAPSKPVVFDVTPYLNEDTNVVAVLYAPPVPHHDSRQLSLSYYGYTEKGRPFCYTADSTWLCCISTASGWMPDGGEWDDGREACRPWRASQSDPALWVSTEERDDCKEDAKIQGNGLGDASISCIPSIAFHSVMLSHVQGKNFFDSEGRRVNYAFSNGVYGQVRLTLREARPGERICYGRNVYICSGEMDEQASPLFSLDSFSRVLIGGDRFFRRSQIWDIEALSVDCD